MAKNKNKRAEFIKWLGPILDALRALGGSAKPREIYEWIGTECHIPEKILNDRYKKSGQLKFPNQIAWARQYLVWENLLESSKHGVWTLTDKGWTTHLNEDQSHEIFLKWVKIFQDLRERKSKETITQEAEKIIDEQEESQPEITQTNIKPTLLEVLQNLSPKGFEQICGRLLREYGFENIEVTQHSHDGGIDGYGSLKINPFVSLNVFFQCKRYKGTVPIAKVQELIGATETNARRVEKCLLITTGYFSKNAIQLEKSNIKLELIDGEKLVEMFEKVELGVVARTIFEPDLTFFEKYRDKSKKMNSRNNS